MTYATVRAAAEHLAKAGSITPHQLAALAALDQSLTNAQRQGFTELWRAAGSPAAQQSDLAAALKIIKEFEGRSLDAYPDSLHGWDVATIGYGTTRYPDGRKVAKGDKINAIEADMLLRQEIDSIAAKLRDTVPHWAAMADHQKCALISFAYNLGSGFYGAEGFETISRELREKNWPAVPAALLLYRNPGTNVEAGLKRRREAEGQLWAGNSQQPKPTPAPAPINAQRTQWVTQIKALNLSQPDASTCQAACIGMAVGDQDVAGIRRKLAARGTAGDTAVMAAVIREYGRPYKYEANASLAQCYEWLKAGEFLITHGWFTGSGHVICLDGLKINDETGRRYLDVKDPWSEFNVQTWRYNLSIKFFDGFYSDLLIYATCVAGTSVGDAQSIYRQGRVDVNRGGMWVHRFLTA
jgi:GH24 family phage-related lysozyme (muramidase)